MRKLGTALVTMLVAATIAASSAVAQEYETKTKTMQGTMTPPDQETMEVQYEMSWGEEGAQGWIIAKNDAGEEMRMEMTNLTMDDKSVAYDWSPPDNEELVVSCELMRQDDGGYAGDCTSNQDDKTGQMTIAAHSHEEHEAHHEKMKEMGAKTDEAAAKKHEMHEKMHEAGAKMDEAGAKMDAAAAEMEEPAPQLEEAAAEMEEAAPQMEGAAPESTEEGSSSY